MVGSRGQRGNVVRFRAVACCFAASLGVLILGRGQSEGVGSLTVHEPADMYSPCGTHRGRPIEPDIIVRRNFTATGPRGKQDKACCRSDGEACHRPSLVVRRWLIEEGWCGFFVAVSPSEVAAARSRERLDGRRFPPH